MNRRDFFKLGIASAAAVSALKGFADDYEIPDQAISKQFEFSELLSVCAFGRSSTVGKFGSVQVVRALGAGTILHLPINTLGGAVHYEAQPECRLIATHDSPIIFLKSDADIAYEAIFKKGDQILVVAG